MICALAHKTKVFKTWDLDVTRERFVS